MDFAEGSNNLSTDVDPSNTPAVSSNDGEQQQTPVRQAMTESSVHEITLLDSLILSSSRSAEHEDVQVVTPSSLRITRSTAKWGQILTGDTEEDQPQSASKRRMPRGIRHYYRRLEKDEAALEEARQLSSLTSDEERDTIDGETERAPLSRKFSCRRIYNLSVSSATHLTLSVNVLLLFSKLLLQYSLVPSRSSQVLWTQL